MRLAFYQGRRVSAAQAGRGTVGLCPWTRREVVAHVGPKVQHWIYPGGQPDLGDGYEIDTPWHLAWKSVVEEAACEVVIDGTIVDIYRPGVRAIELQAAPISPEEADRRIVLYKSLCEHRTVFLVDIREFWQRRLSLGARDGPNSYPVIWKPRRPWLWHLARSTDTHVFADYNVASDKLLKLWIHRKAMHAAFVTKTRFITDYLDTSLCATFEGRPSAAAQHIRRSGQA